MEEKEVDKDALREAIKAAKAVAKRRVELTEDGKIPAHHFTVTGSPTTGPFSGGVVGGSSSGKVKLLTTISVYVDNGNVYEYEVNSEAKAREHAAAIVATGYRSVSADAPTILTWFPPSRILKVVINLPATSTTKYFDRIKST